jgi:arylsulfatase A-like enzyme
VELLTGRYPGRTGWYLHHDAALYSGGGFDPRREVSIARVLRDRGYATGIAGKWQVNNLYDEPEALTQHGFQEQLVWPGSIDRERVDDAFWKSFQEAIARRDAPFLTEATRRIESRYWDPVVLRNGRRERLTGRFGPDVFAEFALDFVRRHKDGPFFLYYPMVLTHGQNASEPVVMTPANRSAPPEGEKAKFADMLRYADRQIGEFFAELDRLGLRENTIVFVASDNGTEKSLSARANGRTVQGGLYQINEAGGNVPLIVNWPARIAGGRTAGLADFTDVFPTICELTQSPPPPEVKLDGRSFAAFLKSEGAAPRTWIYNEYGPDRVVRDEQYKLNQRGELFDLETDPDEQHPLTAPEAAASAARAKLQAALSGMPPATALPFEHRSLSAFKLRAAAKAQDK